MLRPFNATAAVLLTAAVALPQTPRPEPYGGRAKNFSRPGWFIVDGNFAQPQATFGLDALFGLKDDAGRLSLVARPAARAEPLLRNYRTSLVSLAGSPFAWKMSCVGRIWDDTRGNGTQHLLLAAVPESIQTADDMRLTKIEITPTQQVVQAVVQEEGEPISVIAVFGRDFIETAAGPFARPPTTLIRSTTGRQLKLDRPVETRKYLVPLLKLLTRGEDPLSAGAGDVYRVFPGLPADAAATAAVAELVPELNAADPATRQRAGDALRVLGRRGVQAAMRLDTAALPPEAADQIAAFVAANTHEDRTIDVLRKDPNFLLDCLRDKDPNVRAAAGPLVGQ